MRISQEGVRLIKIFEGVRLHAYKDIVGILTIGYGHTGSDVLPNMVITDEEATELLMNDIARFEDCVNDAVLVHLNQSEFDACVSLAFNIGCRAFEGSTLLKLLNEDNRDAAAQQFMRWNKAGGKVVEGLSNRRKAEMELFIG
jgi:lysozyme